VDGATLDRWIEERIGWVEAEMEVVLQAAAADLDLYAMLRYHLGWCDARFTPVPPEQRRRLGGKKLRAVLCLLACEAVGGDRCRAAPAAAAIEFIHNFSLIHDDVEDGDRERRHRPTVWALWGVPQAVNAGSNMQALVTLAGLRLATRGVPAATVVAGVETLTRAMVAMTEGQYLDIGFQDQESIRVEDYLRMAAGKTAALASAALRLGALLGTEDADRIEALARFGHAFGMAFQARDDLLGIWGDSAVTGKPADSDILRGKRSLPIVVGLAHPEHGKAVKEALAARDVAGVMALLEASGARAFTEETARRQTEEALAALAQGCEGGAPPRSGGPGPAAEAAAAIRAIADQQLGREF
jgi:geranylgeranyl diphosphate synthase type I